MSESLSESLKNFTDWVEKYLVGDEKGEAQIFLDHLFQAYGLGGVREAGGHLETRVKRSGPRGTRTGFADYVWKPVVLIEMKRRGEKLRKHQPQAFRYWAHLAPNRPRWVVLCNFDEFWVYDFDTQIDEPMDIVRLVDLPKRHSVLEFLRPGNPKPTFKHDLEGVTRKAADMLAALFNSLVGRGIDRKLAQHFTLQCLVALFAEDIGLLPKYLFKEILDECTTRERAYDLIGGLFAQMDNPDPAAGGRYRDVQYFNGGLFSTSTAVELTLGEVTLLRTAATYSWDLIRPEIFGTIFEHSMDKKRQHALGAHFTSAADIMKIVEPTIVTPWAAAIEGTTTQRQLHRLRERLSRLRILDPACGSGNFLYIAYREMKRLESQILLRLEELSTKSPTGQLDIGFVDAGQFFGMDTDPFAIDIAKVTMMIARKLSIDELALPEQALPLDNLDDNFMAVDSLVSSHGKQAWPPADIIIGNPPFLGAKRLLSERGASYLKVLRDAYEPTSAMVDYCTYWFQRAHEELPVCTVEDPLVGRAGLVATQNIRFGDSCTYGPAFVVDNGGVIVDAFDNHPWSGEAAVNVSIINWIKTEGEEESPVPARKRLWSYAGTELSFIEPDLIPPDLSNTTDIRAAKILLCNRNPKSCFQGVTTGTTKFLLSADMVPAAPSSEIDVLRPFLGARELMNDGVRRWAIDFSGFSLMEAKRQAWSFNICEQEILPLMQARVAEAHTKGNKSDIEARESHLEQWWQYWRVRDDMCTATRSLARCLASARHGRYHVLRFVDPQILLGDALQIFAFDDDYSFGILQSSIHEAWWKKSSRLKNEADVRYSEKKVFATMPWPQDPAPDCVDEVVLAARSLQAERSVAMEQLGSGRLSELYAALSTPGKSSLRDAHDKLDTAVYNAYGFKRRADVLKELLDLNKETERRLSASESVTSPGAPDSLSKLDPVPGSTYFAPTHPAEGK